MFVSAFFAKSLQYSRSLLTWKDSGIEPANQEPRERSRYNDRCGVDPLYCEHRRRTYDRLQHSNILSISFVSAFVIHHLTKLTNLSFVILCKELQHTSSKNLTD